jgi:hypothetical protein
MAGKQCNGVKDFNNGRVKNSKAFCEGVAARTASTNPVLPQHENGSEAWDCHVAGVAVAASNAGSPVPPDEAPCCAVSTANVANV